MTDIMTDDDRLEPDTTGAEIAHGGGSVLDRVKKRRTEYNPDDYWFDIPSWGGELKAKYRVLDRQDVEKMVRQIQARLRKGDRSGSGSEADLDFLIKACVGVKAVDAETEEEQVLADGYDMKLVDMLEPEIDGMPVSVTDQRQLVAYLMRFNNIAVASHAQKVGRWMQDTSKPVEDPQ